ncbi:MAG: hypothetical protein HFG54_01005 [Lachnospiraceae bacterium]|jgi:hypothetical protein|nr:hypothetical protein [Lachnospiraceae bacterium]
MNWQTDVKGCDVRPDSSNKEEKVFIGIERQQIGEGKAVCLESWQFRQKEAPDIDRMWDLV